jgi:hypothetical protein
MHRARRVTGKPGRSDETGAQSYATCMSNPIQDLRYALRNIRRNPVFAAVALVSLALGVGYNTAVCSLMDQILLRLLPVWHPEELVVLSELAPNN